VVAFLNLNFILAKDYVGIATRADKPTQIKVLGTSMHYGRCLEHDRATGKPCGIVINTFEPQITRYDRYYSPFSSDQMDHVVLVT